MDLAVCFCRAFEDRANREHSFYYRQLLQFFPMNLWKLVSAAFLVQLLIDQYLLYLIAMDLPSFPPKQPSVSSFHLRPHHFLHQQQHVYHISSAALPC